MGDGMTVSTTPLEWRSRVRAIAQARPVVFCERDMGQRLLLMREQLKGVPRKERPPSGRVQSAPSRRFIDRRAK